MKARFAADRRDILVAAMHRRLLRILCAVLITSVAIMLMLLASTSASALHAASSLQLASHLQAVTPTPAETGVSRAGSTDGIMWMGVAIVLIILLPLLLKRSTWTKS